MPNRVLRDWTDSEKVNSLSVHSERFFTRLIMKADDYGRFSANTKILKSSLFPFLIDEVREADIARWMAECQKAGLILLYEFESKPYLQVENFNQTLRIKKSKYPPPKECVADATHVHSIRTADAFLKGKETETETERKPKAHAPANYLILEPVEIIRRLKEQEYQVREHAIKNFGLTAAQFERAVDVFVGEKSEVLNKPYDDVPKHFKNWLRQNTDTIKKLDSKPAGGNSKKFLD